MTVANSGVVDFISHDPRTDTVTLSMVEEREWGSQGALLTDLQAKLNAYLAYVLDGQLDKEYPQFRGKPIRFRLHYEFEPGAREAEFVAIVRAQHLEPAGIGWEQSRVGA